jgi:RNA polymerase sigma factor (sigma-70 family)
MNDSACVHVLSSVYESVVELYQDVVTQEAWKAGRDCRWLAVEDLYAEAVLYLLTQIDYLEGARVERAYVRIMVRRYLTRYVWQHDNLVRTPRGDNGWGAPPAVCLSLDGSEDEGVTLLDVLAAPGDQGQHYVALRQAIGKLTEPQRGVLMARFGGPGARLGSFRAIAQDMGIPLSSVHRLLQEGLAVLRRELEVVA